MYAAADHRTFSQSSPSPSRLRQQGLVEPLDGLPGADAYLKDFSGFTKEVAVVGGEADGPCRTLRRSGFGTITRTC